MGKTKRKRCPSSEQKQTKEQVPRGFKEKYVLDVVNKGQNERKNRTSTKQNQTEEKVPHRSFKTARRHSFRTMKNPTTKFLQVALSYFFLTDCRYIQRWSTSCFAFWELIVGWLNHEPLSLSVRFCLPKDKIHRFSSCLVLALFCLLSKDFTPF